MKEKSKRGFASMDKNKRREIARQGGKAAHARGTAHEFTPEEARDAGRKGRLTVQKEKLANAKLERIAKVARVNNRASD